MKRRMFTQMENESNIYTTEEAAAKVPPDVPLFPLRAALVRLQRKYYRCPDVDVMPPNFFSMEPKTET